MIKEIFQMVVDAAILALIGTVIPKAFEFADAYIEQAIPNAKDARMRFVLTATRQIVITIDKIYTESGMGDVKFMQAKQDLIARIAENGYQKYFTEQQLEGYIEEAFTDLKDVLHDKSEEEKVVNGFKKESR